MEPSNLLCVAKMMALELLDRERDEYITISRMNKIGNTYEVLSILNKARDAVQKRYRNVRYPLLCLQIIKEGLQKGGATVTKLVKSLQCFFSLIVFSYLCYIKASTSYLF